MIRFVYLRLMRWKRLQGLFQIYIINHLTKEEFLH